MIDVWSDAGATLQGQGNLCESCILFFKLPLQYWAGKGEKESKTRYKERTQEVRKLMVSCCTLVSSHLSYGVAHTAPCLTTDCLAARMCALASSPLVMVQPI